jgi:hypothetical protein
LDGEIREVLMRLLNYRVARLIVAILVVVVTLGMTTPPAIAQTASRSDLAIRLISAPRHAKACETFKEIYIITNYGPNRATNVTVWINIPDQLSTVKILGVPVNLAPRKSVIVTAYFKVVAYVPGESSDGWVTARVESDVSPAVSIDPKPGNNEVTKPIKFIGKQVLTCP